MSWNRLTLEDIDKCNGHTVVVDVETTGLLWWQCKTIGIGLHCPDAGVTGYFPTLTPYDHSAALQSVKQWGNGTLIIAHNAKFELHFLDIDPFAQGVDVWDTTVMVHLIDSRYPKSLDKAEEIFLGRRTKNEWIQRAPMSKRKKIWEWPLDLVAQYCVNDCIVEGQLCDTLKPMIIELDLWKLFLKDMNFLKEIWMSEHRGLLIDPIFIAEAEKAMGLHIGELEEELYDTVGYRFNWRSTKQLSKALWDEMGILRPKNPYADADGVDRSKFADKGLYHGPMTSAFILDKAQHPCSVLLSRLRESAILRNTLGKYEELADKDLVIHPSFNITGTRTGRLSSKEPNLQNVASSVRTRYTQVAHTGDTYIRSEDYNLRQAFVARPGYKFVSTDWSQMEIRMFGLLSGDPFMLESLSQGRDVHGDIAEKIWGTRDKVRREHAKTISFGLIYGMTAGSLHHRLGITMPEARKLQNDYLHTFPTILTWINDTIDECKQYGFIRYWSGRLWREEDPVHMYKGANAAIQGGCAEVLGIAAIRVGRWLRANVPEAAIINYVHDELIVEAPEQAVPAVCRAMQEIMSMPHLFNLPWKTSTSVGDTYGTMKEITGAEY